MTATCRETVLQGEAERQGRPWRAFFVSWAWLRRADTIAQVLEIPSYSVKYLYRGTPLLLTLWKYFLQTVHTLYLCLRYRPRVVFVTNPPVFAIVPIWLYALLFRARYVVDFHTGCFLPGAWKRWTRWQKFFARRAFLCFAHNCENAKILAAWGVRHEVVPSLPPLLERPSCVAPRERPLAVYICSFKEDEPVDSFLQAARALPEVDFHVTGRAPEGVRGQLPENVCLTGFLDDAAYLELLARADLLIALTTRSDTLLYGAQEAIALHKPVVLSRTEVLQRYFPDGTVFTENTGDALAAAVSSALREKEALAQAMADFEERYRREGEERLQRIRALLEEA